MGRASWRSEFLDKLILLGVVAVFAWLGIVAMGEARYLDSLAGRDRPLLSDRKRNAPLFEAAVPEPQEAAWRGPQSQSRGEDWVFELFTPPVIYYDPIAKAFAVTPPGRPRPTGKDDQWETFEVELLAVRLRPYRLQLVGYAGGPGDYVAYFQHLPSGELLLAREGQEFPEAGVRLLAFEERQVHLAHQESMPVVQRVGVARLLDLSNGQEMRVTNGETAMRSSFEANLRVTHDGAVHVLERGGSLVLDGDAYSVGELSLNPQEAVIVKLSEDGSRRHSQTLTPVSSPSLDLEERSRPAGENPFAIRPAQQGRPLRR